MTNLKTIGHKVKAYHLYNQVDGGKFFDFKHALSNFKTDKTTFKTTQLLLQKILKYLHLRGSPVHRRSPDPAASTTSLSDNSR